MILKIKNMISILKWKKHTYLTILKNHTMIVCNKSESLNHFIVFLK